MLCEHRVHALEATRIIVVLHLLPRVVGGEADEVHVQLCLRVLVKTEPTYRIVKQPFPRDY